MIQQCPECGQWCEAGKEGVADRATRGFVNGLVGTIDAGEKIGGVGGNTGKKLGGYIAALGSAYIGIANAASESLFGADYHFVCPNCGKDMVFYEIAVDKENAKVKKGSTVTITVSKGKKQITIEDYTGMNIDTVKKDLEKAGISVVITAEKVDKNSKVKEKSITKQSIQAGEKLTKGDAIELTYATLITVYPDFTNGKYDKDSIDKFCTENKINCTFTEEESTDKKAGDIISQSKDADSELKTNDNLKIVIAKTKMLTVKFDANGGSGTFNQQTLEYNSYVVKPNTNPTKENCEFKYWELNGSEYNFQSKVTSDMTLKAKFSCSNAPIQANTNQNAVG